MVKEAEKTPQSGDETKAPQDWEKAYSAGYLRLLGASQKEAATAVGVDRDTISRWEGCSWWRGVLEEAERRWLSGLKTKVRKSLEELCEGDTKDPPTVRFVAERTFKELSPPLHRTDLTSGGEPITKLEVEFIDRPEGAEGDD